jgi:hypothetical protein
MRTAVWPPGALPETYIVVNPQSLGFPNSARGTILEPALMNMERVRDQGHEFDP